MVTPAGASRDLWVRMTGRGAPEYGRWRTPGGLDVRTVLGERGPAALDVDVWWEQETDNRGTRLTDVLWTTSRLGLKLTSERMVAVLRDCGARLETFPVDIRWRSGALVEGYLGVLEDCRTAGPVHSLWRGRRSHDFVVSGDVLTAIESAGLTGLVVRPVLGAFPADRPGFLDED